MLTVIFNSLCEKQKQREVKMYFPYYYDWTMIILIPAIVLSFWAQAKVSSTFSKYSAVRCSRGYTGADAARKMLNANGTNAAMRYSIVRAIRFSDSETIWYL